MSPKKLMNPTKQRRAAYMGFLGCFLGLALGQYGFRQLQPN
jgi:hypothetical protein